MFTLHYIIAALLFFTLSSAHSQTTLFSDDFESTSLNQPPNPKYWGKCSGNCLIIRDDLAWEGTKSAKAYLNREKSPNRYRTEAVPRGPARSLDEGITATYQFMLYVPSTHAPDFASETFAQWHQSGADGGRPPLSLKIENNTWRAQLRWETSTGSGSKTWKLGEVPLGQWTQFTIQAHWLPNAKGWLKLWKDGVLVIDYKGPNDYLATDAPWIKLGIYKTAWRNEPTGKRYNTAIVDRTLYFDNILITTP